MICLSNLSLLKIERIKLKNIPVKSSTAVIIIPDIIHLYILFKLKSLILPIIVKHIPPKTKENQLLFPLYINSNRKYEYPPIQASHNFFAIFYPPDEILILLCPFFV